ncbi:MAG: single-stranded DNA-binding protein [Acidimicrobiales bacterium]
MLPTITIEGNAVSDPQLRFTGSGKAVADLRIAASERRKTGGTTWTDVGSLFVTAKVWDADAEALADSSIAKGTKVVATGKLIQREYEAKDGTKRTTLELLYATIARPVRGQTQTPAASPQSDPWGTPQAPAGAPEADGWGKRDNDEPPF